MKIEIDATEMEKQRYNAMKKKGKYIEVNILIGAEEDNLDSGKGMVPIVTTAMRGCTSQEVAYMYTTLKAFTKQFKKEFPMECTYSDLFMRTHHHGTIDITKELNNKEDE